jgi:nicotinamidase-related amidase
MKRLVAASSLLVLLGGCVSTAVGLAGEVPEGAVKTTVFTAKTAGKATIATGKAIAPGDGKDDEEKAEEDDRRRR